MEPIKFGTDGWRAVIAREFTVENVARIATATAKWLLASKNNKSVVIGYDTRFAGKLFAETTACVMASNNIKVYIPESFVSTPIISYAVPTLEAGLGIVITASHNPPSYNGFKLKGHYGGPLLEENIKEVESYIPEHCPTDFDKYSFDYYVKNGMIEITNLEDLYVNRVNEVFDLEKIRNSKFEFAFDAMYGAGQDVIRRIFPDITYLHCENNPTFEGIAPEPLMRNLGEFSEMIKLSENIDCGLAVDGDADRLALLDHEGNYIDSHHVLLLLIHYLAGYKGLKGKVGAGFSSSVKINALCKHYGLDLEIVPIGFKHLCGVMLREHVLVGGEESGGIAVSGHVPERDGIWNGILIWEFMTQTGKSLRELIEEVYSIVGPFAFERSDLHLDPALKEKIVDNCLNNRYKEFGPYKVEKVDTLDGFKYYFNESEWLLIRPSGTEPVLRTYAESHTREDALRILKTAYETITS